MFDIKLKGVAMTAVIQSYRDLTFGEWFVFIDPITEEAPCMDDPSGWRMKLDGSVNCNHPHATDKYGKLYWSIGNAKVIGITLGINSVSLTQKSTDV